METGHLWGTLQRGQERSFPQNEKTTTALAAWTGSVAAKLSRYHVKYERVSVDGELVQLALAPARRRSAEKRI